MVLNFIWIGLLTIAVLVALFKLIVLGDYEVFPKLVTGLFDSSKSGFEFALSLTGTLAFGLGLMKIGEKSGLIEKFARIIAPFFVKIFPGIPKDHPVNGHILMNFSANMLGLDNAATPIGLKAMEGMQELNPDKEVASNAQIMFLTLNASGLTLIPLSIMAARATAGAANPADVFLPILIATFCSTLVGLLTVCVIQRINIFQPAILLSLLGACLIVGITILAFSSMDAKQIDRYSSNIAAFCLLGLVMLFVFSGVRKNVNVYETFIEGAKEGFESAVRIIPYLVAILLAVSAFRNSGAMQLLLDGLSYLLSLIGVTSEILPALPTALMKPLSGSGSRAMMIDTMQTYGPDSFVARLAGIFQGAADTTFYILTVYFGYVGVKNSRYALKTCLIADLAGVIAAIAVTYLFFK